MKRPLIEFKGVCAELGGLRALRHVSFTLFEGEYAAMLGADGSGKVIIPMLLGGGPCVKTEGEILLGGKPFAPAGVGEAQRARVFLTTNRTHLLDEQTIYENLALNHALTKPFQLVNERRLAREAQRALDRFEVELDARMPVGRLTPNEKCVLELIKFWQLGARLVVMLFVTAEGAPEKDALFLKVVRRMTGDGVTVLLLANQYMNILRGADRLFLLSAQGRLAREYGAGAFGAHDIGAYLAGGAVTHARIDARPARGRPVLAVRDLCVRGRQGVNFTLYPGQILGLYYPNSPRCDDVPLALAGAARYTGQLLIDGEPVTFRSERDAIRLGVALLPSNPRQLFFPDLTTEENITQPFLPRMGGRLGILRRGAWRALIEDGRARLRELSAEFSPTGYNDCIFPVIARFMLYPYRVIILLHPSIINDAVKTEMMVRLMKQASERGGALIVASTRLEELEAVCGQIAYME